ncbi:DUF2591 domain-containing protein [Trinickia symbiotica]|uniref:DUF2591 domain-containing protein n=2 Tax=Trinickia symbiotica TaxID=863227 RepID=A0A2N7XA61_9BURK|nr:DUF2591 domain-containing protein [Trinickia symbiotica]
MEAAMKVSELDGRALDYWCARALVDDDEEIRFAEVEPGIVVTLAHGEFRKLNERFMPTDEWRDAGDILERIRDLQLKAQEGRVLCIARFGDRLDPSEAEGANIRLALSRAFVRARFGDSVDDRYPREPHAVRRGVVTPLATGAVPPSPADDRGAAGDETGDIRSVPRM